MNEQPRTTNSSVYINEWDAFPAAWLRNQFLDAVVDETSIVALNRPPEEFGPYPWGLAVEHDLSRYEQVHFFAGIGGWPEALRLAAWPKGVQIWTGSCPCQPFSGAGEGRGFDDERDLWPDMFRQIKRHRPGFIVGEQVANGRDQLPLRWLDRVFDNLEAEGYTCWACDLPAACAGAPIIRQRLFWGAVRGEWAVGSGQWGGAASLSRSAGSRLSGREDSGAGAGDAGADRRGGFEPQRSGDAGDLPGSASGGCSGRSGAGRTNGPQAEHNCGSDGIVERSASDGRHPRRAGAEVRPVGGSDNAGPQRYGGDVHDRDEPGRIDADSAGSAATTGGGGFWDRWDLCHFTDGKVRRIEPGTVPLAHGIPAGNQWAIPWLGELGIDPDTAKRIVALARSNRVGTLRGYGNAIVPQVAAIFLRVWMDELDIEPRTRNEEP